MLRTVYSAMLHKGKPLYSSTSHRVENQQKKIKGRRFNPLAVQMIYGERKIRKMAGKIQCTVRWFIGKSENTPSEGLRLGQGNGALNKCA